MLFLSGLCLKTLQWKFFNKIVPACSYVTGKLGYNLDFKSNNRESMFCYELSEGHFLFLQVYLQTELEGIDADGCVESMKSV